MNAFDSVIVSLLTGISGEFWKFDFALFSLSDNDLLKGGIFMIAIWALWFRSEAPEARSLIIATLFGATLAVLLGKILEHLLPLRLRPYEAGLDGINFPYDMGLEDQTSFPSDHAVLFFSLAMGIWFSSRSLGIFAFLYAAFVICLPRVYLGLHYPTDILAGAVLGIGCAFVAQAEGIRSLLGKTVVRFAANRPTLFYPLFFVATFQLATLFDGLRDMARLAGILL